MQIEWILLAAGLSRRFGGNKLLFPVDGKAMYRHGFEKMISLARRRKERVTVVTSSHRIAEEVQKVAEVVWNPAPQRGMSSSIQCALLHLGIQQGRAYLFFVADQPYLPEVDLHGFVEGFLRSGKRMGCVTDGVVWGNPCIFCAEAAQALFALQGDVGGKVLLRKEPKQVYQYRCMAPFALWDIDETADLTRKPDLEQKNANEKNISQ